jgi:enoyl-CoA hydratase/carnithine racemase
VIRLGCPPANAIGQPLLDGLSSALDAFDASSAKVLIVSSSIPGFFAAGADIQQIENGDRAAFEAFRAALREPLERLAAHCRPSIAVVEGLALGGGLELAMAATFRVAGDNALRLMLLGKDLGDGGSQDRSGRPGYPSRRCAGRCDVSGRGACGNASSRDGSSHEMRRRVC